LTLVGGVGEDGVVPHKMPTTIAQGFVALPQNLEITPLQEATVSTRQRCVREAIERELTVLTSFLTGSYKRSTMIGPLAQADVDIFVVLAPGYYAQYRPAALLDRVRTIIKKTYPTTPGISRNGQAVTIRFSDFQVDVVPGYNRKGGGYLIPNSVTGTWIETDPTVHVRQWSEANAAHNSDLVPVIKMLKCWNRSHSNPFRSFHLEALTRSVLTNVRISDFPSGVRYVLDKAQAAVQVPLLDPAGYGGNLGSYLDTPVKMQDILNRVQTNCQRAKDAEAYATHGRNDLAYQKWGVVFGDSFPAYG
jgi:hypothetical protein